MAVSGGCGFIYGYSGELSSIINTSWGIPAKKYCTNILYSTIWKILQNILGLH